MNAAHEQLVGRVLGGRYRLDRVIGRGGMGVVFQATQLDLARGVAVKVLLDLDTSAIARLRQEALTAGSLSCPYVVSIFDFHAPPNEVAFVVMELLAGESLAALLARERVLDVGRACRIATETLIGLDAAHRASVVHRDVKPSNIWLLNGRGMEGQVKVLDFGIAKRVDGSGVHTTTGSLLGTPSYLSPEQLRGQQADPRADQHAVGVVLFEMLTGRRPWREQAIDLLVEIAHRVPPPVHELAPHVPPALSAIVARALEKNPAARFASADEMRIQLAPFVGSSAFSYAPGALSTQPVQHTLNVHSSQGMPNAQMPNAQTVPSQRGIETASYVLAAPTPDPGVRFSAAAAEPPPKPKRSLVLPLVGAAGGVLLLGLTGVVGYLAWLAQRPLPVGTTVDAQAAAAAPSGPASAAGTTGATAGNTSKAGIRAPTTSTSGGAAGGGSVDAGAKGAVGPSAAAGAGTKPKCACISHFNTLICQRPMTPICFCEDHGSMCPVPFDASGDCPTDTNFGAFKGPTLKTGNSCSGFKKGNGGASVPGSGKLACNVCYGQPKEPAVPNTVCQGIMAGADSPNSKIDKDGLWVCDP